MNKPNDLYMMITKSLSWTYSQEVGHLLTIMQIFKHLPEMYKIKHNLLFQ